VAERTSYVPGTPCWVDLSTSDVGGAARFYGGLFGWAHTDLGSEAGGYGMFSLRGHQVAGVGPQMSQDVPLHWSVYVSVNDADATAASVRANGGEVVAGPMDVFGAGRMAVAKDSLGSFISIWQPNEFIGSQLVNEPGTFTWNELSTPDMAKTRAFYTAVFGWGTAGEGGGDQAAIFTVEGNVGCGAHAAGPGEPQAWSVWFSVEDCDASTEKAQGLGGSVIMPPNDMDFGRGAVLADPQGAVFGIGSVKPQMPGASA
jgi:predicted enzyme related to lactoylglutathione lyase